MKSIRLLPLFLLLFQYTIGQEWFEMMDQPRVNYFEVKAKFEIWLDGRDPQKVKGAKQFYRWEHAWKNTIDENGNLPDLEAQRKAYEKFALSRNQPTGIAGLTWTSLGPNTTPGGYAGIGRVNYLAFHPTNKNIYYALASGGGLWKTENGGGSYTPVSDNLILGRGVSVVVAPSKPDVLYLAGTFYKIFKSIDGAKSWQQVADFFYNITSLSVNPRDENDLISGSLLGIHRTKNGGVSFQNTLKSKIEDIQRNPKDPNIVYAAGYEGTTLFLYRSLDGGDTWQTMQQIFSGGQRPRLAVSPAAPGLVEVATCNQDWGMGKIFSSVDTGKTFIQTFSAVPSTNLLSYNSQPNDNGGIGWHCFSFAISPTNPSTKFIGSVNCWKTVDNAKTWFLSSVWANGAPGKTVHADNHFIGWNPADTTRIYRGNDGGVYLSTNRGDTWQDKTNGMTISEIYNATPPPPTAMTGQKYSMYGLQDNGTKRYNNQLNNWQDVQGGDGFVSAMDFGNPDIYYTTIQYGNVSSNQNGCITCRLPPNDLAGAIFTTFFVMNPRKSETLVAPFRDLFRTYDKGMSWVKMTENLFDGNPIVQVLIAPSDTNVIYARTPYAIKRSLDGGKTWEKINIGSSGIINLAIHPQDANKILIILVNSTNYILQSDDAGKTWRNISGDLPANTYKAISFVGGTKDDIYLCSFAGVFYKDSTTSNWQAISGNLPYALQYSDLTIDYANNQVILATFGRSAWTAPLIRNPVFKSGGSAVLKSEPQTCVPEKLSFSFQFNRMYFKSDNTIKVQLSDPAGNFDRPIPLGTQKLFNNTGDISLVLPDTLKVDGKYRVRIIANNEADTIQSAFAVTVKKAPPASIVVQGGNTVFCTGSGLTMKANSGTNFKFQWYRDGAALQGSTSDSLLVTKGGKYAVKVSQGTQCDSLTEAITITEVGVPVQPRISRIGTTTLCFGDSILLQSDATSGIQWFNGDTLITGQTGKTLLVKGSGNYTVKVTLGGGCSSVSDIFAVKFNLNPPVPVLTKVGNTEFCQGDSLLLTSSASSGNLWYKDGLAIATATIPTIKVQTTGSFSVQVTNTEGCQSVSAPVSVKVNSLPAKPTISVIGTPTCCEGTTVQLTAPQASGYQWYRNGLAISGANANKLEAGTGGDYLLTVLNAAGCASEISGKLSVTVNSNPAKPPILWDGSQFSTLAGFSGYRWLKDGVEIAGSDTNVWKPSAAGNYKTKVIDQNTCSSLSNDYPLIITSVQALRLGDSKISCFPNPVNDVLFIEVDKLGLSKIRATLYDLHGRVRQEKILSQGRNNFGTGHLPTGIYQLELSNGSKKTFIKILVTK